MREALLTVREVSGLLHVHPKTVYAWTEGGKLPSVSIHGRVRFERRAVDRFIENRKARFLDPGILQPGPKITLDLSAFDRLHLKPKGGRDALSKNSGRWNYGIGSVFLRKTNGGKSRWYIYYRDGDRRQVIEAVRHAQSRGEAVVALRQRILEVFDKKHHPERIVRRFTFRELSERFLREYAMKEKKSWRTDEFRLRRILEHLGDMELASITDREIGDYRQSRIDKRISELTANRELALLKKMFNFAIEKGLMAENPARKIKMFSERDTARDRTLSPAEELRLLPELAGHMRPLVVVALHTGLRLGEILGLKWADVSMEKRTLKVEHTKGKRARFIPLNSVVLAELGKLKAAKIDGKVVFPFKRSSVRAAFENAFRAAKVDGFTFHDLRRTFGTRLLERGVNIVTIQKLYGHSSVLVTQNYLHPRDVLSQEAVEMLAANGENRDHSVITETEEIAITVPSRSNSIS